MDGIAASGPFDTVAGLPVHALVVHVVVVLVPLTALGATAMALVPRWSVRFGVLVPLFALASTVAALVAQVSGEQLASRVGLPAEHAQLGMSVKWFAIALLLVTTALWWADRRRAGPRPTGVRVLSVLVIVIAIAGTWWVVLTGDSGARAVWENIIANTSPQ
jgi:uncharacterized membrane protein